jgi:hypothetical protein
VDLISRGGKGGKRNKVTIADSAVSTLRQWGIIETYGQEEHLVLISVAKPHHFFLAAAPAPDPGKFALDSV